MSLLGAVAGALSVPPVVSITDYPLLSVTVEPTNAIGKYRLNSDGTIDVDTGSGYVQASTWITPASAAPSDYEARMTHNSGAIPSGTLGSWVALSSAREWTLTRTTQGVSSSSCTLEIRKGSGAVLDSATITWSLTVQDLGL